MPKLRFPEFCGDDVWNEMPLDGLSKRIRRKVGSKELTPVSITAGFGFVDQTKKFGRRIAGEQYKNYIHIQRGDFVYNKGNSKTFAQGCIYQLKEFEEAAASTAFICFKLNASCVDIYFQNLFECNTHGRKLLKFITSGARSDGLLNINPTDFFSIELPLPPRKEEQQRIAECLSAVDEVIAAQARKLDALKSHKKGLMQELFPREGETLPKLRFPEFRDAAGWEESRLADICSKITQGGTPDTSEPKFWGGSINWMTPAEMGKTESPFIDATTRTITESGLDNCSSYLLPIYSVILSVRAPIGSLAINTTPMAINQGCKGLITGNTLSFSFLYYSLINSKARLIDLGAGNTFKELSGSALKSYEIGLPSPPEQQKIAACLSSVDEVIAAQAQKLEALKTHKKGLMQQLFPSPEEVEV
jgi:type I restriction enzyme S subunit